MKRKLLLSALLSILCVSLVFGKSVGYNADGGFTTVTFSVLKIDSLNYIVVSIESTDKLVIDAQNPEMKIRFFNGEVMTLSGLHQGEGTRSRVMGVNGITSSISSNTSMAKFPVTDKQIEKFSLGVKKIRISTLPKIHDKEFKKDKFGNDLYKLYLKTEKVEEF